MRLFGGTSESLIGALYRFRLRDTPVSLVSLFEIGRIWQADAMSVLLFALGIVAVLLIPHYPMKGESESTSLPAFFQQS
jgi:hypothetical protein